MKKVLLTVAVSLLTACNSWSLKDTAKGVGAEPDPGAVILFDGTKESLHKNWTYWEGPAFKSSLPVKWKIQKNPAGEGI